MGIEECVDVNCNFVWSFLLEASPSANLHLQSTTFAVLRLTANGEPWMPFGNHCRSDSQRNAVMLLRERHKVKRFSVRTVWKDLVFFFFFLLYRNIFTITWNSFHSFQYLWKTYCFLVSLIDSERNEISLKISLHVLSIF